MNKIKDANVKNAFEGNDVSKMKSKNFLPLEHQSKGRIKMVREDATKGGGVKAGPMRKNNNF